MVAFTYQGLLSDGPQSYLTGITDLDIYQRDGAWVLYSASGPSGGVSCYQLDSGGSVTFLDRDPFTANQLQAAPGRLEEIVLGDATIMVTLGRHESALQCFDVDATGKLVGTAQLTTEGGFPAAIVSLETLALGSRDLVYASHWGQGGLTVYEAGATGQLVEVGYRGPVNGAQGADLVAIEAIELDGQPWLVTVSAFANAVTTYRIGAAGMPVETDSIGSADGLGISAPSALATVSLGDAQYLVLAAAGSSSLSVLQLGPDGGLEVTDHVLDSLDTRFQSVTALETITIGDRVFLVAGGGDDGLSLFTLLPGGRLLHLARIADDHETALTNVTALALHERDGVIDIFASAEGEAGITWLSVDPGALLATQWGTAGDDTMAGNPGVNLMVGGDGDDNLDGWAGDDILMDGAGRDILRGGQGADIFVLSADGEIDTITDFEIGIDRLDLSALGRIYSLAQVSITTTSDGAVIRVGTEEIRLISVDYTPLPASAFTIGDLIDLWHFPFVSNNDAPPDPDPDPEPDPAPDPEPDPEPEPPAGPDDLILGTAGADELRGGHGQDSLRGSDGKDTLYGGTGNDMLWGGNSDDLLHGGTQNDTLKGGLGNDVLNGGDGSDVLLGDAGRDVLRGDTGSDQLFGGDGKDGLFGGGDDDTLSGGAGADLLEGGTGSDQLKGGDGDDVLRGGAQHDTLSGDAGNDRLNGEIGNDDLLGGSGDDTLSGGAGADLLDGGTGSDKLKGGTGGDVLRGGAQDDFLTGDAGNDRLYGGTGGDDLWGGSGSDRLYGDAGDDRLQGGSGTDWLQGGSGRDTLSGGYGRDTLNGGADRDTLNGGGGDDRLKGGEGADVFVFSNGFGDDTIVDFDAFNQAERIDLSGVSAIGWYGDLMRNHISQVGNDVVIDDLAGNTITLRGVSLASLDATDFVL